MIQSLANQLQAALQPRTDRFERNLLDACDLGHRVNVVTDACRGVDLTPGDSDAAMRRMQDAGARLTTSDEISVDA